MAHVGHDPFDDRARRRIVVDIRGTTARVGLAGAERSLGQRTITAESCTELVASIAVVLAMTVTHTDEPSPSREEAPLSAGMFVAGAAGLGDATTLTTGLELWRGHGSVAAELRLDLPREVAGGMIGVTRVQASASPCLRARGFAGCVVGSVGVLRGRGVNVVQARTAVTPTAAVGLRVVWQHGLTRRVALRLHADLAANLFETRLDLDAMPAWTSPRFEGLLGAGVLARFR